MNIVYFSNTDGHHRDLTLPTGDLLICGGGLSKSGTEDQILDFIRWFDHQPHFYKVFIAGNNDKALDCMYALRDVSENLRHELAVFTANKHNFYLENNTIEIEGVKIHGTPHKTHTGRDEAFCVTPRYISQVYKKIPKETHILITSYPPYNRRDYLPASKTHAGNTVLGTWIGTIKPDVVLTGGIHQSRGVQFDSGTAFINGAVHDPELNYLSEPWSLTYKKETGKTRVWRNVVPY